jgi:adenine-specific DNA-methyltransferase
MARQDISTALKSFNERYASTRLNRETIENFSYQIKQFMLDIEKAINNNENEEYIKNIINLFLYRSFYSNDEYIINTNNYIDSTIKKNDVLLALIEVKKPTNKIEMVSENDINKKAFWEIVYYYLDVSRNVTGDKVVRKPDIEIRRLIITDAFTWVLIDPNDLENFCDGYLEKHFYKYKNNQLAYSNNSSKFFEDIKNYLNKCDISKKLNYVYVDLKKQLVNRTGYQQFYKLLSHEYLLKDGYRPSIKVQALNNGFYQELLYIMGLVEIKSKSNTVIKIDTKITNSFAEQVYKIYTKDKEFPESIATEKTFELIIIWLNRLLFIKLFEGQLLTFNGDDNCYYILNTQKIKNFEDLQLLFFDILGNNEREDNDFYNQFTEVPYLNSSLFERQEIERIDININELKNNPVKIKTKSILGKHIKQLPLLTYLLDFLNSYTFSSETDENTSYKEIIDASVLGLIFEKINGYKDGAVYTPSKITEYMSRNAIEKNILHRINSEMGWTCADFNEVKFNITSLPIAVKINNIINLTKVCDPAVGSGHFLVSALNRIIAVKAELGILFKYQKLERLSEVDIFVEDDVLCVVDAQGKTFKYDKNNKESQEIEETLFNEKRIIIEECLFGVDINPKAVYICQLRLWIELLKNAYYKKNVMQTLPNIDINIHTGNSLINKLDFIPGKEIGTKNNDIKKQTKKLLEQYKYAVRQYKSVSEKSDKQKIRDLIKSLKSSLYFQYVQLNFFDNEDRLKNANLYNNAFEWAFEFPELISDDGVFLGFDIILGNPPYGILNKRQNKNISISATSEQINYYKTAPQYQAANGGMLNIFRLFICRSYYLLKENGSASLIIPLAFLCDLSCSNIRNFLFKYSSLEYIEAFPERDNENKRIFESAKISVCIIEFSKRKPQNKSTTALRINSNRFVDTKITPTIITYSKIKKIDEKYLTVPLATQNEFDLIEKIASESKHCKDYSNCYTGEIDLSLDKNYISSDNLNADMIRGAQVQKYKITKDISQGELLYLKSDLYLAENSGPRSEHHNRRRIVMQGITGVNEKIRLKMALLNKGIFCANSVNYLIPADENDNLEYLLGLLNSKLLNWFFTKLSTNSNVNGYEVDNLPIKDPTRSQKEEIVRLVNRALSEEGNIYAIQEKIDDIVYQVYGLNESDIELINN